MDSQIYLLLLRQSGSYKNWAEKFKSAKTAVQVAMIAKELLNPKDLILGDSLDAPFVKFIRVTGVNHKIGFEKDGESKFEESGWAYKDAWKEETETSTQYAPNPFLRTTTSTKMTQSDRSPGKHLRGQWGAFGNQFVQSRIPEHGEIEFSKHVDSATPQLAYGCSAQEKFPLAIFFYRRKVGLGMGGIRWPYFVTAAFNCKLTEWEMKDDGESVSLFYKQISWCGYDQWADTNISYPWSTRWFDQENYTGGQGGLALAVQLLIADLIALSAAISAAATASDGESSGDSSELNAP